jgi:hypothetical protein
MSIETNGCIAFTSTAGADQFVCVYHASILVAPSIMLRKISERRR